MNNKLISLVTIKQNSFQFLKDKYLTADDTGLNLLKKDIEEHIQVKELKFEDMMEVIVTDIQLLTPELVGDSLTIHETATNVYQLCFTKITKNENNPNNIASYLTSEEVCGNAVFINSKITDNNTCEPDNSYVDDLVKILYSKFIHKGIIIPSDEMKPVSEFNYIDHPLEYYKCLEEDYKKYKAYEFDFLKFNLCLFIKNSPDNSLINKRATRLIGTQKINGDVILLSKTTQEYNDIDCILYKKLIKVAYGPLRSRSLTDFENQEDEKLNNLPIVMNKYCVLEKRYNNLKKTCNYCNTELIKELICTGCYRIKYHNEKCQIDDWDEHKKECLFNKNPVNK